MNKIETQAWVGPMVPKEDELLGTLWECIDYTAGDAGPHICMVVEAGESLYSGRTSFALVYLSTGRICKSPQHARTLRKDLQDRTRFIRHRRQVILTPQQG